MIKRATKKNTRIALEKVESILKTVRSGLRRKGYRFEVKVVGSKAFNTILISDNEYYDIDVRILLTNNTKEDDAQKIFQDFYEAFMLLKTENLSIARGKQTIRCYCYDKKRLLFTLEFVILKGDKIIRENTRKNVMQWHNIKLRYEEAYSFFDNLQSDEKQKFIEEFVLPLKIKYREAQSEKSSISIFLEAMNYYKNMRKIK